MSGQCDVCGKSAEYHCSVNGCNNLMCGEHVFWGPPDLPPAIKPLSLSGTDEGDSTRGPVCKKHRNVKVV